MTSTSKSSSACSIRRSCERAIVDSFCKLDPRHQLRNPVMFTVLCRQHPHDRLWIQRPRR